MYAMVENGTRNSENMEEETQEGLSQISTEPVQLIDLGSGGTPNEQRKEEVINEPQKKEQELEELTLEVLRGKRKGLEEKLQEREKELEEQEKKLKEQENTKKKIEARIRWLEGQEKKTESSEENVQVNQNSGQKKKGRPQLGKKQIEEEKVMLQKELDEINLETYEVERDKILLENKRIQRNITKICEEINQRSAYIIQNLNVLYPQIYEQLEIIQKFRFFGLNEQIVLKKEEGEQYAKRRYNRDRGTGFGNFMRILFPSPAGELSIHSMEKGAQNLEKDCAVTPKLIAQIAAFIYDYRTKKQEKKEDAEKIEGEIDEIIECFHVISEGIEHDQNLTDKFKDLGTYVLYQELYEKKSEEFQMKLKEQKIPAINKQNFGALVQGKKGEEIKKDLQFFWRLNLLIQNPETQIKEENFSKFTLSAYNSNDKFFEKMKSVCPQKENEITLLRKTSKFFETHLFDHTFLKPKMTAADLYRSNTILHLLKSAIQAIDKQEGDAANHSQENKFISKYTVEKMLMGYFRKKFPDQKNIEIFRNEIARLIQFEEGSQEQTKKNVECAKGELQETKDIMNLLTFSKLSPYKENNLISHGNAQTVGGKQDEGNGMSVRFGGSEGFADCADTAARHVVNLLGYSVARNWDIFLGNRDQNLKKELDEIKVAIQQGENVKYLPLKRRLQLYFYHQSQEEVGANAGDQMTRTLWEYVICNMDENPGEGMYNIKYVQNKKYELETGFINLLKLIYNIARALKTNEKGELDNSDKFKRVETGIQELETVSEEKIEWKERLKAVSQEAFQLINEKANVLDVEVDERSPREIYGKVEVGITEKIDNEDEMISFKLSQDEDHAGMSHNPIKIKGELNNKTLNNEFSKLLALKYFKKAKVVNELTGFSRLYGGFLRKRERINLPDQVREMYESLHFLKEVQGDEGNNGRMEQLLGDNGSIRHSKVAIKCADDENIQPMNLYIFRTYVNTGEKLKQFFKSGSQSLNEKLQEFYAEFSEIEKNIYVEKGYIYQQGEGISLMGWEKINDCIIIPKEVTKINQEAFVKCKQIQGVIFEEESHLTKIGAGAFEGCEYLYQIKNMPEHLTEIGKRAFQNCGSLGSIIIPTQVRKIEDETFQGCRGIRYIEFSENSQLEEIGYRAFEECAFVNDFRLPRTVRKIGQGAFENWMFLNNLEIEEDSVLEEIGQEAFAECSSMSEITIPRTVRKIGQRAFKNCTSLQTVIIEDVGTLEMLGDGAFEGCDQLENVPEELRVLNPEAFREREQQDEMI